MKTVFEILIGVVVAVLALGLTVYCFPEIGLLFQVIRERGVQGTRVRLRDGLEGAIVRARGDFVVEGAYSKGRVTADGEIWSARCRASERRIAADDRLKVLSRRGLTLLVEPADEPREDR